MHNQGNKILWKEKPKKRIRHSHSSYNPRHPFSNTLPPSLYFPIIRTITRLHKSSNAANWQQFPRLTIQSHERGTWKSLLPHSCSGWTVRARGTKRFTHWTRSKNDRLRSRRTNSVAPCKTRWRRWWRKKISEHKSAANRSVKFRLSDLHGRRIPFDLWSRNLHARVLEVEESIWIFLGLRLNLDIRSRRTEVLETRKKFGQSNCFTLTLDLLGFDSSRYERVR